VTAETIARALGGRKSGRGWSARCPAHDDRTPSLSLRDGESGRVLVHCHAGCDQGAVIDALRARGLWPETIRPDRTPDQRRAWARQRRRDEADLRRARWFARAASAVAEEALAEMDVADCRRMDLTRLLAALRSDLGALATYREDWREREPHLTAALVGAGEASDRAAQEALTRLVNSWRPDAA
jgi:hypothetical protein